VADESRPALVSFHSCFAQIFLRRNSRPVADELAAQFSFQFSFDFSIQFPIQLAEFLTATSQRRDRCGVIQIIFLSRDEVYILLILASLGDADMKWRIGEWVACSDSDSIRMDGVQRKIERRAMETLVVLAERAGHVVMKDELIASVWGRMAVSDHSVAMVVSQLRRAMGDDARSPRYIETITKRGYRLIADCERLDEAPVKTAVRAAPGLFSRFIAAFSPRPG
jgi:DNA-binding winged helix-turn-helix (wHTH) protein